MVDEAEKARLAELEARINSLKKTQGPEPRADEHYSQANIAWRMVTELVAGLGIGFGVGFGLDWAMGTTPWFMIVFVGLGFAAGINVMMRTAKEVQEDQEAHAARQGTQEKD